MSPPLKSYKSKLIYRLCYKRNLLETAWRHSGEA